MTFLPAKHQPKLSKGSEWRRWDLHIHTPDTALNNQFGGWEEYISTIEKSDAIKVIAVTDYMMIDNYQRVLGYKEDGRLGNIECILPNIEFRLAPPSDKATSINIHLLISPDDPDHARKITNALSHLHFEYNSTKYSCVPEELKRLGKAFNQNVTDSNALSVGVGQFKVDFTKLRDWYESEHWLKNNSLVAVSAGDDGLSGFSNTGGWAALREEITRFSQVIFSGRPGERDFWLGRNPSDADTLDRLGGKKPCLHGSDAHDIKRLFRPDRDRFCWIKADPTFEGLKQVLYEPEGRVHIGPTRPDYHDQAQVINTVRIDRSDGWFDEAVIPLNAGLVSIIGRKGAGKSALVEIIAYSAGGWTADPGSFLERARKHLAPTTVELHWGDGAISKCRLGDRQPGDCKVRYLSQKFVERLCADEQGDELVREIESVVFSYIDPTDTLNASTFDELRALKTTSITAEARRIREDVLRLISEECGLRANAAKLPDKKSHAEQLEKEKSALLAQMPATTSQEEENARAALQQKRQLLADAQVRAGSSKHQLQNVSDIRAKMMSFSADIKRFNAEVDILLSNVDVPQSSWAGFHPEFPGNIQENLSYYESKISENLKTEEDVIANLKREIAGLAALESNDKARQDKAETIHKRVSAIGTQISKINAEVQRIEGHERKRLEACIIERNYAYRGFFDNLCNEQMALQALYAPIMEEMGADSAISQHQPLEFSIVWQASLSSWMERGGALFDKRTHIPYDTLEGIEEAARNLLVPAWTSGKPDSVEEAMNTFVTKFGVEGGQPAKYLRAGYTERDLLEWLYEVDHVRLTFGLKYNGTELENLSPGTKGIVLLMLYLGMDVEDRRPLIVDQPDDNLDNESVYKLLTGYFRAAKTRRQVILITHNPNLVVNADSEQIIVAAVSMRDNGMPRISYSAGALEENEEGGIRHNVCTILEGGTEAFRKRERRYFR